MRKHTLRVLIALLAAGLGGWAQAVAQDNEPKLLEENQAYQLWETSYSHVMYLRTEALWLRRNLSDPVPRDSGGTTNAFEFQWQPGLRAAVGVQSENGRAIELSYFGLIDWYDGLTPTDVYSAQMNNFEANWLRFVDVSQYVTCSTLVGFRYLNLQEDVILGEAHANTTNNLLGLQLGAELVEFYGPFTSSLFGRAGLMGNIANQQTTTTGVSANATDGKVAGIFELGVFGTYSVTESIIIRCGYQALFITSLALAPEQIIPSSSGAGGVDQSGIGIYHGPSIGLQWFWGKPRW